MACLAPPQFKWPSPSRVVVFREPDSDDKSSSSTRPVRVPCVASSTAVVDAEHVESVSIGLPVTFDSLLIV
jgi:hypothetical protein